MNRRNFMQASGAIAAGLATCNVLSANVDSAPKAIDPIARNGKPFFKYSLAAYSYRRLLLPSGDKPAELQLSDFISDCAEFQLQGTELTSYYFPSAVTPGYLRQLRKQCFQLGLDVSGTAVGNDFGFPEGEERRKQIEGVKRWIEHAEILGAPVIRIFAGHKKDGTTPAESHSLMVSAIEECCDYAGRHGVHLALENHGGPTATAKGLLRFVKDVNSPWFGVNLDSGNFHSENLYDELAEVAPYAINAQIKVKVSGPDGKKKDTNFTRVAKILAAADYRGYVVLEFEEDGDPRKESARYLREMRPIFNEVLNEANS